MEQTIIDLKFGRVEINSQETSNEENSSSISRTRNFEKNSLL